ncbi:MAG TPA: HAMP domain-containing sensor histidine kinase [Candidatus Thermoplasmatota archaeon]|nr:HAMP domain-containing sensor histidine kinase [Candidatus Thermoplasmatota archaeon]
MLLTDVSFQDVVIRIIVSGCFFIAGVILGKNLAHRKHAEDDLKEAYEALNHSLTQLQRTVAETAEELGIAVKQNHELILGLSHDLKTPLTPLMGLLPLLIREEKDPKLKELLETSLRNVHYLRDLVGKTIDLALLDSTTLGFSRENVPLMSEIDRVLDHRSYALVGRHIFVDNKVNDQVVVVADKLKLREILNNLVMNSIKYTPSSGGTITLQAFPEGDHVKIWVTDTGIGMTSEQLRNAFDGLYKADPARGDHTSAGLGLKICKRIVEKHGGRIWAESPGLGKGTTVFFTLPAPSRENQG